MDEWIDGSMIEKIDGWIEGLLLLWMDGFIDEWIDGSMVECIGGLLGCRIHYGYITVYCRHKV